MKEEFWQEKWRNQDIRFHQDQVQADLIKYFPKHPPTQLLVPLCGKSLDILVIASQGRQVVGAELSPLACKSFFEENKIAYSVVKDSDFEIYRSDKIEIWCGNFFKLPDSVWARTKLLYDRAALVALPEAMRAEYAHCIGDHVKKLKLDLSILLISLDYPDKSIQGPAFSVPESEVRSLYSTHFQVERLLHEVDSSYEKHPNFSSTVVSKAIYLMKSK